MKKQKNKLVLLIEQFQKMLEIYFKQISALPESESNVRIRNLYQLIVVNCNDNWSKYQAILKWCNEQVTNDRLNVVKERFIKMHNMHVAPKINISVERQKELQEMLNSIKNEFIDKHFKEQFALKSQITEYEHFVLYLRRQVRQIQSLNLSDDIHDNKYHVEVTKAKKIIFYLKNITPPVITLLVVEPVDKNTAASHIKHVKKANKIKAITESLTVLDRELSQYNRNIKSENFITRFFKFFSPARRLRKMAIGDYEQNISSIADPGQKYIAAKKWHKKYSASIKKDSRFYKYCLHPFTEASEQNYFDRKSISSQKTAEMVDKHHAKLINASEAHKNNIKTLNVQLLALQENSEKLLSTIKDFETALSKIIKVGGKYSRGQSYDLEQAISNIKQISKAEKCQEDIEAANRIVNDIAKLTRLVNLEVIRDLKLREKVNGITINNVALKIVTSYLDKLLDDVETYGRKLDNPYYLGTKQIGLIIKEIGTQEQIKRFNLIKEKTITYVNDNAKNIGQKSADNCTAFLINLIENQELNETLTSWQNIFKNYVSPQIVPVKSHDRHVYDLIVEWKYKAKKYHKLSQNNSLKELVEKVIRTTLKASYLNQKVRHSIDVYGRLEVANVDMIVKIFGNKRQQKEWIGVHMNINANLEKNSLDEAKTFSHPKPAP